MSKVVYTVMPGPTGHRFRVEYWEGGSFDRPITIKWLEKR